jgi:hypothetical protein
MKLDINIMPQHGGRKNLRNGKDNSTTQCKDIGKAVPVKDPETLCGNSTWENNNMVSRRYRCLAGGDS